MALLFAVFWGYLFYGVIDLFVFLQGREFHESFHLETGWGLFFLVMVAAPLVAVAVAPETVIPAALQQVLLAGVAVAIAAVLSVTEASAAGGGSWRHSDVGRGAERRRSSGAAPPSSMVVGPARRLSARSGRCTRFGSKRWHRTSTHPAFGLGNAPPTEPDAGTH